MTAKLPAASPASEQEAGVPASRPFTHRKCRLCGAPVIWLRHVRSGRPLPVDPEPAPSGRLFVDLDLGLYEECLHPDRPYWAHRPKYTSHLDTCPNRARRAAPCPADDAQKESVHP